MNDRNHKMAVFVLVSAFLLAGNQVWGVEPPVQKTDILLSNAQEITFSEDSQKITATLKLEKPAGILHHRASATFETTTLLKNDTGVSQIPTCGNSTCDEAETCDSCPQDCLCQCGDIGFNCDGQCGQCPACSPCCGDGICNGTESYASCSADCPEPVIDCGNGTCESTKGETCISCPSDCGACGPKI